mmetsp:Transcript_6795/g.22942  ORF Transcript_6795/g.22942 Transcript_6795/m.22942 type:complete len:252 (+) Transcript_6795:1024-1779(+)
MPRAAPRRLRSINFTLAIFVWSTIWKRQPRHAVATATLRLRRIVVSPAAIARFRACCFRKKRLFRCGIKRHPANVRETFPNINRLTTSASFASRAASSRRPNKNSVHTRNARLLCLERQCLNANIEVIQIRNARRPTPASAFRRRKTDFERNVFAARASSDQNRNAFPHHRFKPLPISCFTRNMVTVCLTHSAKHFCFTFPKNFKAAVLYFSRSSFSPAAKKRHLSTQRRVDCAFACAMAFPIARSNFVSW